MTRSFGLNDQQRFERFVPDRPETGCWIWRASLDSRGYGHATIDGRLTIASRWSWQIHRGAIPDGACVLHRCDVRACVNPDHLFLGSKSDNMFDMHAKRRHPRVGMRGESNPSAKITEDAVRRIRLAIGTEDQVGAEFGISPAMAGMIRRRKRWAHVEDGALVAAPA